MNGLVMFNACHGCVAKVGLIRILAVTVLRTSEMDSPAVIPFLWTTRGMSFSVSVLPFNRSQVLTDNGRFSANEMAHS